MRTGMFKRFLAVCLTLTMVLGLLPGMTLLASALVVFDDAIINEAYHFTALQLFGSEVLATITDPEYTYVGFTLPTDVDNSSLHGQVGYQSGNYITPDMYGYVSGEAFNTRMDYYFYANALGTYAFSALLVDEYGRDETYPITIKVNSINTKPTDIGLTSAVINASSTGAGATVGTLSTTDADAGDTHTYSFVSGTGDTNNSDFQISGATLQTSKVLAAGSYSILVKSTDSGNLACEKAFTINVFTSPSVTTNAAGSISTTGATLNGTVNAGNGSTTVTFEYGTSPSYGSTVTADQSPVTGLADTSVSKAVTGLVPNTTYHYRVSGVNTAGTANGSDLTFTTGTVVPVATTDAADGITTSDATLHGTVNANNEGTTVTFQYGTTTGYGSTATAVQSPVAGTSNTSVSCGLTGLTTNTTYHYRVVAVNATGRTEGSDQTFTTLAVKPAVTTGSASGIASTGATIAGAVNANNAGTTATFEYGLDTSYGSSVTALQSPVTGTGNTDVSAVLYSLLPNTIYHYRAVGENIAGTTNGSDMTFTTAKAAPVAITDDTCILDTIGATLHGMVNANNDDTTVTFEYGLTNSYGTSVSATPGTVTGTSGTIVRCDLAGLTPNTTYHFRVVAVNSAGRTEGSDETFTTLAEYPAVTTGSAGAITESGATLNGTVNANNADTAVTFQYGLTTSYGSSVSAVPGTATGMGITNISAVLTDLLPNTTYHFRAVGVNTAGSVNGSDVTFTTGKAAPNAATNAASSVSSTAATLNGTVNASNESTTVTFEYGTTTSYGIPVSATQSPVTGTVDTPVSYGLTGLTPNTMYHYRVVAVNPTGTTIGLDQTFNTSAVAPSVTTGSAGSITSSGAVLSGTVNANNADTAVTFHYGLTTSYGSTVTAVPDTATGTGNTSVSAALSGLLPNTAYHFMAVGVNTAGTTNGLDATFTTGKAAPNAVTNDAGSIAFTAATLYGMVNAMNDSTTVTFEYGLTTAYGTTVTALESPVSGSIGTSVSYALSGLTPSTTYHFRVAATNSAGTAYGLDKTITTPLKPAAVLAADTSANDVDHALEITFDPDAAFEAGITAVTYGGVTLAAPADYAVSSGKITLMPAGGNAALHTPGTADLVISAAGFNNSSISQTITAGMAAAIEITTQPVPGINSGDLFATQPVLTLKDQYGNICVDGPSSSAMMFAAPKPGIPGAGNWSPSGAGMVSALNGIVTFTDLACNLISPGTSAIVFLPGPGIVGVPPIESSTFTIPLKAAVALTADTSNNSVDHELRITFASSSDFENAVSSITFGGTVLTEGTDYTVYSGSIALKPAGGNPVLRKPATFSLVITAAGFRDTSVTQTITAGEAASIEASILPVPGAISGDGFLTQPVAVLKDQYGNTCADGPSASAEVTISAVAGTGKWTVGGTLTKTAASGIATFTDLTLTQIEPGNGSVRFASNGVSGLSLAFDLPLKASVVLYANTSGNSVDNALEIIFPANADFEKKITGVNFGSTVLVQGTDYKVTSGKITLKPAGGNATLRTPGTANVVVSAAGYRESTVSQTITAGAAASLVVTTQPVPGKVSGDAFATQPKVTLYDQYGNICFDGPSSSALMTVSAAADTGTWTIGGETSRLAVNGVAAYGGLTSSNLTPGMGKMDFTSGDLTVSSTPFAIPERNSSISASAARFDKYVESGNHKNITVTLSLNGNTMDAIRNGSAVLVHNTDYTVDGNTAVIKKEYLAKQPKGTLKLTFDFSQGIDPVLSVTVSDSTPASPSVGTPSINVIVNGEGLDAGSVSTTEQDGKTETTVTVDNEKLLKILDEKGHNASVVIPVTTESSVSSVVMNGQMVRALQSSQATLQVQTVNSTYTLPSDGLDMDTVAQQLGENVPRDEIKVNITIAEPPAETVQVVKDAAAEGNFAIMVPAVEFKVECSYNDQTVEVSKFNAYVERTIAIPDGVDPYKITTAVVVRPDKTTYHVPTKITMIDGKYYAVINSLTNSTYTVVWHPVTYEDMKGHWAEEAVNDMGSRMVVIGVDEKNYAPDQQITRADFVADVVRALGLNPGEGVNPYADVLDTDWYCAYVKTAVAYGLLTGDGTTPFAAQEAVSREEAMGLIAKAMKIAKMDITFKEGESQTLLQAFGDGALVAETEKESTAACLKAEVTFDLTGGNLLPKAPVLRAEAAVILRLLLKQAELI